MPRCSARGRAHSGSPAKNGLAAGAGGVTVAPAMKTCYACDAPATGGEHVPPQCIFPKDDQYRKNLTTVPSCDEHNLKKCKNDEYLKFVLSAVGGMNELAHSVFGSVMRSFDRRPHLIDRFTPDLQVVQVCGLETGGFTLDVSRFENSIKSIVRGLFFNETGKKLTSELRVAWAHMLTKNYSAAPFLEIIQKAEREIPANYLGANPKVFLYAIDKSKSGKTWLCRLKFYEGYPICITWKSELNHP
jgi:hypothetical protein